MVFSNLFVIVYQLLLVVGFVFVVDKILDCCRTTHYYHPIPSPSGSSGQYATRSLGVPVPNPM